MKDSSSEMSLDEVLSSIKKMVIDSEPPVLELTDMVAENGDIVKVKSGIDHSSSDMGSFLKLIQANTDAPEPMLDSPKTIIDEKPVSQAKSEFLKEIASSLIQKWIDENLPNIVKDVAEAEIKKILSQN